MYPCLWSGCSLNRTPSPCFMHPPALSAWCSVPCTGGSWVFVRAQAVSQISVPRARCALGDHAWSWDELNTALGRTASRGVKCCAPAYPRTPGTDSQAGTEPGGAKGLGGWLLGWVVVAQQDRTGDNAVDTTARSAASGLWAVVGRRVVVVDGGQGSGPDVVGSGRGVMVPGGGSGRRGEGRAGRRTWRRHTRRMQLASRAWRLQLLW